MVTRSRHNITLYVRCQSCSFFERRLPFSTSFHHCSTNIHRLLPVFFISTEEVKRFLHLRVLFFKMFSFHRCYWSRKTVSPYFEAPEIIQLAKAVLTGDSVAPFIRWKQMFCDSSYKITPSAPSPTEQSVIIPPFNTKYS